MTTPKLSARDRLLAAADELFYAHGIQAVGIDKVIEQAGVAKASLYNAFGSKDDLVRAYLEGRAAARRDRITKRIEEHASPREKLLSIYDSLADSCARPGFRGCCFMNASSEDPAGESPAREVSREVRRWTQALVLSLVRSLPCPPAAAATLSAQLCLLYDGAVIGATLDRDREAPGRARKLAAQLIDARR